MYTWPSKDKSSIFPEFYVKRVIPNSQAITLFSTPLLLAAAAPDWHMLPRILHIRKAVGAYTLNGSTLIQITHGVGGGVGLAATASSFADQATDLTTVSFGPGNTVALYPNYGVLGTPSGLYVATNTANWSGSGGELEVTVVFNAIPIVMTGV